MEGNLQHGWGSSSTAFKRRQEQPAGHEQARRLIPANVVDPRCSICDLPGQAAPYAGSWLVKLVTRRNANIAAVALANKTARTIWALLAHQRAFRPDYARVAEGA